MNALLLINFNSGRGLNKKKVAFLIDELKKIFTDVDFIRTKTDKEFSLEAYKSCGVYDALIFAGGDGTFNLVVNAIAEKENRPILGIIPTGTINDASKIFNIKRGIKSSLRAIKSQKTKSIDIGKINDKYFVFSASLGAYADIPFRTEKAKKKIFGPLAYYVKAVPEVFKKSSFKGIIKFEDNTSMVFEAPFLLILNGTHMGGFKINKNSDSSDGEMDLFFSEPALFNSLLRFLLFRYKLKHYSFKEIEIITNYMKKWDMDGEIGPTGTVRISVENGKISAFCNE
jgi:diacylglycerol kinase (ATP)